jgi:sec-independent protein translocase protein TatA
MVPTLAFILGPLEMLIVGGIFLLLFGGRIPTVMRSLGQSVTSFKSGLEDDDEKTDDESGNSKKK